MAPSQLYFGPVNSIAILPFGSGDTDTGEEILSTGFSSELHRLVTATRGLQVTSANSSFFFGDSSFSLPVIAEHLQVSNLLTGEFQFSGSRVRLLATLFDARNREEAWTREFEGSPDQVFELTNALLAEVAGSVLRRPAERLPKAEPLDSVAWENYLAGLHFLGQRTPGGFESAQDRFQKVLDIEPDHAFARVGLARAILASGAAGNPEPQYLERARNEISRVLESKPDFPAALGLLSHVRRQYDWDWRGALEAAEKAVDLNPGDPELMSVASLALFSLGRFDAAEELLRPSAMQDPLNLGRRLRLGLLQEFSGEYEQSLSSYRQIVGLNPDFPGARAFRARVKILQDKPDSALRESDQEKDPFWRRYSKILALSALDRSDESQVLLEQMISDEGRHAAFQIAEILAFNGETDSAFEWLQRAYEQKDGGMREMIGNRFLNNLHGDKRWEQMITLLGLPLDLSD
jgi:TolB-like protein/thioredoxin-like negative regulator of GroEL